MIHLVIATILFAATVIGVSVLLEFRRIDKELNRVRRDAKLLKSQLDWLQTWMIKKEAR